MPNMAMRGLYMYVSPVWGPVGGGYASLRQPALPPSAAAARSRLRRHHQHTGDDGQMVTIYVTMQRRSPAAGSLATDDQSSRGPRRPLPVARRRAVEEAVLAGLVAARRACLATKCPPVDHCDSAEPGDECFPLDDAWRWRDEVPAAASDMANGFGVGAIVEWLSAPLGQRTSPSSDCGGSARRSGAAPARIRHAAPGTVRCRDGRIDSAAERPREQRFTVANRQLEGQSGRAERGELEFGEGGQLRVWSCLPQRHRRRAAAARFASARRSGF